MRTENEISSRQLRRRIQSQKKNIINALFPDNILPVISKNSITKEVTDISNNINTDNSFQDRSTFPLYYSDDQVVQHHTSIFSPSNFNKKEASFKELIASWAVKESINQKQLRGLLTILKTHSCHNDLPSDPRTLLQTPRQLEIYDISFGTYWHYGLKKGVINISNEIEQVETGKIEIVIGIDGLPISKSSGSQLWPILGRIFSSNKVFIIGIYHGWHKKPENTIEFLDYFVKEARDIIENGLDHKDRKYKFCIKLICADTPAKSYILGVKGHSGYSSCTKCWNEGKSINRRICFSDTPGRQRTDDEFLMKSDTI